MTHPEVDPIVQCETRADGPALWSAWYPGYAGCIAEGASEAEVRAELLDVWPLWCAALGRTEPEVAR